MRNTLLARRGAGARPIASLFIVLSLISIAGACGASNPVQPPGEITNIGHRVLFIGNSLTYTNNLPGMLRDIGKEAGDTISIRMVAFANYALIDHIREGTSLAAINSGPWDVVVLQQGPTTLGINRDSLILWTQMFDPYIRAGGARPALMMAWTYKAHLSSMPLVHESFEMAANAVDGLFLPVGEAWLNAWKAEPGLPLYGDDDFHPTPLGTAIAALVIEEQITGRDPRTMPTALLQQRLGVTAATVRLIQEAAHAANVAYAHR